VENLPDHGDRVGGVIREQGDIAFYWKPDSNSARKLLVWTTGKGYSYFHNITASDMKRSWEDRLSRYCNQLYEKEYPYDIVQLRYTKKADNGPVDTMLCAFVDDWNSRYRSPRLVISDLDSLFAGFERRYGDRLPVVTGELSPYWEDGAYSTAAEEIRNRELAAKTVELESFAQSVGKRAKYDEQFYQLHRCIIMFHEHTWGSWCSVSDPDLPFTTRQWDYKKAFLDSGLVRYEQLCKELGFKHQTTAFIPVKHPVLDFDLDLRHGGLSSIYVDGRNLVDTTATYRFFELVYAYGLDPTVFHRPEDLKVLGWRNDKHRKVVTVSYSMKNAGRVTATYTLNKSVGVLDCRISFEKIEVREKESLHLALPFSLIRPRLRFGSNNDLLEYGKGQLPGSNNDFICAEERVELDDGAVRLVIRSPEFNLFEVGEIIDESRSGGSKVWRQSGGNTANLFLYLLNNYWHTNYKASQKGTITFHVSISAE
ncbi:MAG: hypothetical protein RL021_1308, partial [Bacteroidota bacterium]